LTDVDETGSAIAIGPRIVASGGFGLLYREGMGLIEEVASYLDGDGKPRFSMPPNPCG
jgi:regulator of CtrA degradation